MKRCHAHAVVRHWAKKTRKAPLCRASTRTADASNLPLCVQQALNQQLVSDPSGARQTVPSVHGSTRLGRIGQSGVLRMLPAASDHHSWKPGRAHVRGDARHDRAVRLGLRFHEKRPAPGAARCRCSNPPVAGWLTTELLRQQERPCAPLDRRRGAHRLRGLTTGSAASCRASTTCSRSRSPRPFEPHVGVYLNGRRVDGSECRWARVLADAGSC